MLDNQQDNGTKCQTETLQELLTNKPENILVKSSLA